MNTKTIRTSNGKILCGFNKQQSIENFTYIVIDGNTRNPIGVFDTLEKAKENGIKITNDNCIIFKFQLNKECTYNYDNMYQSKNLKQ